MYSQSQLHYHPSFILFLIGMVTGGKQDKPQWESIPFQPVLKAYPTWHSWIITMHISLGNLNKQLCMFYHQKALAHELLMKLQYQTFASIFVLNAVLGEFTNIDSIYQSYIPTIQVAIQLLWTEPVLNKLSPADSPWPKGSLLPFLGDALQCLTWTATMKDMTEIKQQINLLMQKPTKEEETLVHIISILNVTWYTTQVNRQKLNEVMEAPRRQMKM